MTFPSPHLGSCRFPPKYPVSGSLASEPAREGGGPAFDASFAATPALGTGTSTTFSLNDLTSPRPAGCSIAGGCIRVGGLGWRARGAHLLHSASSLDARSKFPSLLCVCARAHRMYPVSPWVSPRTLLEMVSALCSLSTASWRCPARTRLDATRQSASAVVGCHGP